VVESKPSPNRSSTNSSQGNSKPSQDSLTNAASKSRIGGNSVSVTKPVRVVSTPAADADADSAPALQAALGDAKPNDPVSNLLNTPTALPTRAPPISQGVEGGDIQTKVAAIYPPQARAMGQHGTVTLEALVGPDGSVKDVKVVSGPPLLRQAAIDAVRRWKYEPFRLNGKRITAQTQVQIDFKLQ
jgi:TonB family protein